MQAYANSSGAYSLSAVMPEVQAVVDSVFGSSDLMRIEFEISNGESSAK
jgi:hypothetical protein